MERGQRGRGRRGRRGRGAERRPAPSWRPPRPSPAAGTARGGTRPRRVPCRGRPRARPRGGRWSSERRSRRCPRLLLRLSLFSDRRRRRSTKRTATATKGERAAASGACSSSVPLLLLLLLRPLFSGKPLGNAGSLWSSRCAPGGSFAGWRTSFECFFCGEVSAKEAEKFFQVFSEPRSFLQSRRRSSPFLTLSLFCTRLRAPSWRRSSLLPEAWGRTSI